MVDLIHISVQKYIVELIHISVQNYLVDLMHISVQNYMVDLIHISVQNYMVDLIQKNIIPVSGVYFGENQNRWTWEDILTLRAGFISEFSTICVRKEPIYMKVCN
jgi:poly(3-hydroxyalkanoate) synthetase